MPYAPSKLELQLAEVLHLDGVSVVVPYRIDRNVDRCPHDFVLTLVGGVDGSVLARAGCSRGELAAPLACSSFDAVTAGGGTLDVARLGDLSTLGDCCGDHKHCRCDSFLSSAIGVAGGGSGASIGGDSFSTPLRLAAGSEYWAHGSPPPSIQS